MRKFFTLTVLLFCLFTTAGYNLSAQTHVVISQVYGGGGNSGAQYTNDFIELFNPTTSPVNISGWSIQYTSAAGTSWSGNIAVITSGTIPAGGYFLIKLAASAVGSPLPTPDATPTTAINMSATAGKVALVSSSTALSTGTCPVATVGAVIDFVGYGTGGSGANCSEGLSPASTLSNTTAAFRKSGGCTDTDVNSADFTTAAPSPRNSASPLNFCGAPATVSTTTVSSVTTTTASSGGNVTVDGGSSVSARGVVWNTSTAPTTSLSTKTIDGSGLGSYTSSITGLVANTKYFYRAYAINASNIGYGTEFNFTTLPNAPVVGSGSNIGTNGFTANWTAPAGGTETFTYTLEVDDDNGFGSINFSQTGIASSNLSFIVNGLSSSSTYYYRVKAVNTTGNSAYSTVSTGVQTSAPATPTLSINTTPAAFGSLCINSATAPNSFTISGSNLDGSDINIAPLAGYSYSTTVNGTYTSSLNFSYSGSSFSNQTIYVIFAPTVAQSYNGNIILSGGGLTPVQISVTGTGINTQATVATGSNIVAGTSATANGSISATGCGAVTTYGFEYSTTAGFAGGTGTQVVASNLNSGSFSKTISGLAGSTTYYYKAFAVNNGGTAYGNENSFTTSSVVPVVMSAQSLLRYSEDFDDVGNWSNNFVSGVGANHFSSVTSNATGTIPDGVKITTSTATFTSGTSGGVQKGTGAIVLLSTGATDNSSSSAIDFYMDFTGMNAGTLSFDWESINNSTGNRNASLRVYGSTDGISFTELTLADVLNFTNNVPTTGTVNNIALPSSFNNSPTARLRFYFYNGTGGTTGSRPKLSIDNLTVTGVSSTPCATPSAGPTSLTFGTITETSIQGSFLAANPTVNEYLVIMSSNTSLTSNPIDGQTYFIGDNVGDGTVIAKGSELSFTATGLTGATTYNFFIFPVNSVCTGGPKYLTTNVLTDDETTIAGLPSCTAPAAQASNLVTTASINSIQGSFSGTAADEYLVLQSTSTTLTGAPVNGITYNAGAAIGNATVVQRGANTSFNATGLTPATQYYYFIFSSNSQNCVNGPVYNTASPLSGTQTTQPLPVCATPSAQPTDIAFNASNNSVTATFNGAGTNYNYLVVMSSSPTLSAVPADNTDYAVGSSFGGGTVVSNNTSTSFIATGLTNSTTYYFFIFSANENCTGGSKYLNASPLNGTATTTNAPVNNIYFGNFHAHSDYSDGNKDHPGYTPADDYNFASGSLGMDFLGISEHNHFSSVDNPGNEIANYHMGTTQAAAFNATHPNFLALYGMEWGVISGGGHVVVYGDEMNDLFGWESNVNGHVGPNYDVYVPKSTYIGPDGLFKTVNSYVAKNTFATLAHPNNTDYNNLANIAYDSTADAAITGSAVESGPATSANITYSNPPSPMYYLWYFQKLLSKGYHLGPTIDHDNHNTTFGRTTTGRTAVIAPVLTETEIVKAMRNMHFYATEDIDARVDFTINTRIMGSVFEDRNAPSISVNLTDPTHSTAGALIRLMFGVPGSGVNPVVIDSVSGSSLGYVDNALPNRSTGYYYVDITFNGGKRIITSPIWYTRTCAAASDTTASACGSFTWYDSTYTLSTTATRIFTTVGGCDSTVTLHLTIKHSPASATIALVGSDTGCPGTGVALTATADTTNGAITAYQWMKAGSLIATTTAGNYTALASGNYSVTAVNAGNCSVVSNSLTVTVADTTAPVASIATLPTLMGECSVTVSATPTATDNCAGTVNGQTTDPLVYATQGTYTITWTYSDGNGNSSTQMQTVIVKDLTAPVLSGVPSNVSAGCDNIPAAATVTATDNCDASPVVSFTETSTQNADINTTAHYNYAITRTWTATDVNGNSSSQSQTVIVTDTQLPVITAPANITINNDAGICGAIVNFAATATDNCSPVTISYSKAPGTLFNVGVTTVTVTATDISGNTAIAYFGITVNDTEKPTITAPGAISVPNDAGQCGATITGVGTPVTNDNCGVASVTNDHPSHYYPSGTTIVTWTVTDNNGLTNTASQTITVTDGEPPVVYIQDVTVYLDASGNATVTAAQVNNNSTDNCAISSYSLSKTNFNCTNLGANTVTLTAMDANGNAGSATATVTVKDNIAPVVKAKGITVYLDATGNATVTAAQVNNGSMDNCGISSYNLSKTSFNCSNLGANTVTLTITDAGNNTASTTTIVTVKDNISPIAIAQPVTVYLNASGATTVTAAQVNNNSTDNCGIISYSLSKTNFNCSNVGANTVTLTVVDASGNSNSTTAVVTVKDNIAPVITAMANQVFCVNVAHNYAIPVLIATDNCGSISVSYTITGATIRSGAGNNASGLFNVGVSTINWTVNDGKGNTATSTTTVTISVLPTVTITASNADAFCNQLILSASSAGTGATYKWMSGTSTVANTQQISLGQSNSDGVYQVTETINGCTSVPASYSFQKQNLVSSYTVLAFDEINFGENNIVATGSIGVTSARGEIDLGKGNSIASAGSFVKAKNIDKNGTNITIANPIYNAATGITLPTMLLNTVKTNNLPNKDVAQNSVSTVSGNYKNITLHKGSHTTLTGNTFGTIRVEQGAQVTFTSGTLYIDVLQVVKGPRYGYSYVRFTQDTKVMVSSSVTIGSQVYINPDNNKVTFYMGDNKSDPEKFTVKGGDTKVTANVYVPNGKLKVTGGYRYGDYGNGFGDCDVDDDDDRYYGQGTNYVYMTGLFIAEEIDGNGKNVVWNSFDCNAAASVAALNSTASTQATKTVENGAATTDDDLKVTVSPNPSITYFTLKIESSSATPVTMRVIDERGRVIDAKSGINANSTIQIGQNYAGGTYYAEMIQGARRKVVKLIKMR